MPWEGNEMASQPSQLKGFEQVAEAHSESQKSGIEKRMCTVTSMTTVRVHVQGDVYVLGELALEPEGYGACDCPERCLCTRGDGLHR